MVTPNEAPATNRPYPPPSNVTAILQRLRSRNLPERIDSEYLRDASIPEGTNARTLFALRFLGIIEHANEPSAALRSIATSTDEEYRTTLAGLIRDAYADVFASIDPAQDPQHRIVNFFRRYTPASQRERMVIFFLGMCRDAGIPTLDVPRQRASRGSIATPMPASRIKEKASVHSTQKTLRRRESKSEMETPSLPPALETLVRSLPPAGSTLTEEERKQWLVFAEATLSFIYPNRSETKKGPSTDNNNP